MRTCNVDGCDREFYAKGLCHLHYSRLRRTGSTGPGASLYSRRLGKTCSVEGCEKPLWQGGHCGMHRARLYRTGELGPPEQLRASPGAQYRIIDSQGYARLYVKGGRRITEHKAVMEQHLGRPLAKHENVHHINGVRDDNLLANLELWSKSQPAGQRVSEKLAWAAAFLTEYGYIVSEAPNAC